MNTLTEPRRILFLDDDPRIVQLAVRLLTARGYSLVGLTDAGKALEVFRGSPESFSMVVTDHNLAHHSGLDVAREILAMRRDIPVVLCSGLVTEELDQQSRCSGIARVIQKPLDIAELCESLHAYLNPVADSEMARRRGNASC